MCIYQVPVSTTGRPVLSWLLPLFQQRVAPLYLETLTTTTDQKTGHSVCVKEHLTDCGVVIHDFGEPLLGEPLLCHGHLIEFDVSLCEEVVLGLITCGREVLVSRPHLLGESAQRILLLNLREDEGQEEVLEDKDEEEEENGVDEKVKSKRTLNSCMIHGDDHGME